MTRYCFLGLAALLALQASLQAQQPKAPPRHFTNSIGMKFVWIQPGSFLMGSPKAEKQRSILEVQHPVRLSKGFYMSTRAVTQAQWEDIIISFTPEYVRPAEGFDLGMPYRFQGEKTLPAEGISWNDCQVFIKKLREKDRLRYRLPTEAEWEYACRAGTTTPFYTGATISTSQANFDGTGVYGTGVKGVNRKRTTPVGSFPANAWGLYDMHGNVGQWCQDRFGKFTEQQAVDPQGAEKGGTRIVRGGTWEAGPGRCRSASRAWFSPDNRGRGNIGFRICFSLE